ncbi:MAG TPA: glycosyltransferase [Symbiobacteriaceae bacterium]
MTEQPVVAVGCPVRNRAWILPRYLEALSRLAYPGTQLRFGFIVNDSTDATEAIVRAWDRRPHVDVINLGYPSWRREAGYSLANLALLRNRFSEWALATGARYLFSVDSDILVPPDALGRLLAAQKPVVSMLVCNTPQDPPPPLRGNRLKPEPPPRVRPPRPAYNILYRDAAGAAVHYHETYPKDALFEVDVTGAAYLIDRQVFEAGVRYAYHPQGEDMAFCLAAKRQGFGVWCDSRITGAHIMREPVSS